MIETARQKILLTGLIIDIIIIDQLTKWIAMERFLRPAHDGTSVDILSWFGSIPVKIPYVEVPVTGFFNIVMVWNKGVSFGLFNHGSTGIDAQILMGLALVISVAFLVWLWRSSSWFQGIAIALVIGGALGNVIDRARFGAVADFLDFHIAGLHWPAFNIADSAIVIGIGLLIFYSVLLETKHKKKDDNA